MFNFDAQSRTNMERNQQESEQLEIITYKAEKVVNGEVVGIVEESFIHLHVPEFSKWKYEKAIAELKPQGALMKFYINDIEQLLNC